MPRNLTYSPSLLSHRSRFRTCSGLRRAHVKSTAGSQSSASNTLEDRLGSALSVHCVGLPHRSQVASSRKALGVYLPA
ncbi:hypothetical protein MBM_04734 [Drepanopeziza brunnea f. sp. 'multigermtubi' MB_m1]|uniref:Uncharacterized protein n=1 Tax=Marssonina brunnea f. sp. multigermtubi (strain MB_m1) TaxID=1072389 RepID=K1WXC7_MARBU|nr:uncharacterized protein MBM_04734 [Drepanopeziza brunnea f. sp. 'multigermtubi' MB_m1]EKD17157.1 hypothetical protein MBM_04734 [Drepanopeziza brunnea f. sp. 'multigermtubi' MB_m1]